MKYVICDYLKYIYHSSIFIFLFETTDMMFQHTHISIYLFI